MIARIVARIPTNRIETLITRSTVCSEEPGRIDKSLNNYGILDIAYNIGFQFEKISITKYYVQTWRQPKELKNLRNSSRRPKLLLARLSTPLFTGLIIMIWHHFYDFVKTITGGVKCWRTRGNIFAFCPQSSGVSNDPLTDQVVWFQSVARAIAPIMIGGIDIITQPAHAA